MCIHTYILCISICCYWAMVHNTQLFLPHSTETTPACQNKSEHHSLSGNSTFVLTVCEKQKTGSFLLRLLLAILQMFSLLVFSRRDNLAYLNNLWWIWHQWLLLFHKRDTTSSRTFLGLADNSLWDKGDKVSNLYERTPLQNMVLQEQKGHFFWKRSLLLTLHPAPFLSTSFPSLTVPF